MIRELLPCVVTIAASVMLSANHEVDANQPLVFISAFAAGEQGAMNALAGFDPAQAVGIQGAQQNMAIDREKLAMVRGSADVSGASEVNFAPREELRVRASGASEVTCYSSPASKEVSLSGASELNYKSN